jgi:glycosyl hydrolase family 26
MVVMTLLLSAATYGLVKYGFGHRSSHVTHGTTTHHQPKAVPSTLPPTSITVKKNKLMGVSTVYPIPDRAKAFSTAVGRQPDIVEYYLPFGKVPFPASVAYELGQQHQLSLLQIDPRKLSLHAIATGKFDPWLHSFAKQVHTFGAQVAISFGHEMNGWWYSWCVPVNHTEAQVINMPKNFVAAWRHIHDVFQDEKATNVTWVWTITRNIQRLGWPTLSAWWPGNKYVDWVGMDGYFRVTGETFTDLFSEQLTFVRQLTSKPVLITETAVDGRDTDYASQVQQIFQGVTDPANGMIGFIWFDVNALAHWNIDHVKAMDKSVSQSISHFHYK